MTDERPGLSPAEPLPIPNDLDVRIIQTDDVEDWATRAAAALCRVWSAESIADGMSTLKPPRGWCQECGAWVELYDRRIGEHMEETVDCAVCYQTTYEPCDVPDHAVADALRLLDQQRQDASARVSSAVDPKKVSQ